nr:effector protein [Exserohilum turcicum]
MVSFTRILGLLTISYFQSCSSVYAELARWVSVEGNSTISLPFNETALLAVLTPNNYTTRSLTKYDVNDPLSKRAVDAYDPALHPNGRCPINSFYVPHNDDTMCDAQFHIGADASYASQSSSCSRSIFRRLHCQLCAGRNIRNPSEIKYYDTQCGKNQVCTQASPRWNAWGRLEPQSYCHDANTLVELAVAKGATLREYCSQKFRFPKAGSGKTATFHAWLYNTVSGLREPAKWMYLKVNGAYARAVQSSEDWTTNFPIDSGSSCEMCIFPFNTDYDLELDWSAEL